MKLASLIPPPYRFERLDPSEKRFGRDIANAAFALARERLREMANAEPQHVNINIKRALAVAADELESLRIEDPL